LRVVKKISRLFHPKKFLEKKNLMSTPLEKNPSGTHA